ncbi:MAG: NADH-quinone oxidoreductase subunit J [Clostridiales bacterium]|nr:NADH-quinone oxidoreductase subunit J [Clostridiales bacterium]MCF8022621.1 NADH-quinone oxidoreductase subunit J [Clostridiales bacterium]
METCIYNVIAFYMLAAVILGSAVMIVAVRNIVHSVLFLAACFISMAGIYLLLDAVYLAIIQVLIYAGAVCIMIIFGIMLIRRADMKESNLFNKQTKLAAGVVAMTLAVYGILAGKTAWTDVTSNVPVPADSLDKIGGLLLSQYVIPFEVAALLLTVALIGAIMLAREVKADGDN